jgi:hypothetical protein
MLVVVVVVGEWVEHGGEIIVVVEDGVEINLVLSDYDKKMFIT